MYLKTSEKGATGGLFLYHQESSSHQASTVHFKHDGIVDDMRFRGGLDFVIHPLGRSRAVTATRSVRTRKTSRPWAKP